MSRKLGEVCHFYSGTGFSVAYQGKEIGELPFYKVGDIAANVAAGNVHLSFCNNYISRQEATEIKGTVIPKGTVVFAKIGEALKLNRRAVTSCDCLVDNNAMGIAPDLGVLRGGYFYYFMKKLRMQEYSESTTVPSVRKSKLEQIEINVPSLDEQKQIETVLDKASKIIRFRQEELQRLDNLIKARFVELFGDPITNPMGWHTKRFDTICENLDNRRTPITASERESGIYPYYGASGIVDYVADYIFDEDILLISEDGANLLMRSTPIAFSVSGKVWVNNHAHVVRFENMGLQKYVEVYFSLIDISDQITGSAQPKLNQAKLNAMEIPIPDKDRTDSFLNFLRQIDKSKAVVQKALDKAQLLFDSLMQQYFG